MDKKRAEGTAEQIKGSVKEAIGKITGNERTEAEGKAEQVEGKAKRKVGEAQDTVRDAFKK